MMDFLAGALTLAYVIATFHFVQFWRRTADRLFLGFAVAFALFALNGLVVFGLGVEYDRGHYAYFLRVLGFLLILIAVIDKNVLGRKQGR